MTRSRRSSPWAVLGLALAIVVLLVGADLIARTVAERKLAERVAKDVPAAASTSARIRSFPFLGRLIFPGHVSRVDVTVTGVEVRGLRFDSISVDLRGVELDRDRLLREERVVIQDIRFGTVKAIVTQEAVSDLTGVPIRLEAGRASVTVFGRELGADLAVRDGRLVIGASGLTLPGLDLVVPLLPCLPDAQIVPGTLLLMCEFSGVPAELAAEGSASPQPRVATGRQSGG